MIGSAAVPPGAPAMLGLRFQHLHGRQSSIEDSQLVYEPIEERLTTTPRMTTYRARDAVTVTKVIAPDHWIRHRAISNRTMLPRKAMSPVGYTVNIENRAGGWVITGSSADHPRTDGAVTSWVVHLQILAATTSTTGIIRLRITSEYHFAKVHEFTGDLSKYTHHGEVCPAVWHNGSTRYVVITLVGIVRAHTPNVLTRERL